MRRASWAGKKPFHRIARRGDITHLVNTVAAALLYTFAVAETKHFELIQGVINRLANNQLVCKGWAISVVAAAAALTSQKDAQWYFTVAAAFPPAFFWWLDAYYLQHERKFRALYQDLVAGSDQVLPMSMDIRRYGGTHPLQAAVTSWHLVGFYLVLILVVVALGLLKRGA